MVETCYSHEGNPIRDAPGGPEYPAKETMKQPELCTDCREDPIPCNNGCTQAGVDPFFWGLEAHIILETLLREKITESLT